MLFILIWVLILQLTKTEYISILMETCSTPALV